MIHRGKICNTHLLLPLSSLLSAACKIKGQLGEITLQQQFAPGDHPTAIPWGMSPNDLWHTFTLSAASFPSTVSGSKREEKKWADTIYCSSIDHHACMQQSPSLVSNTELRNPAWGSTISSGIYYGSKGFIPDITLPVQAPVSEPAGEVIRG